MTKLKSQMTRGTALTTGALMLMMGAAQADQVIQDDSIVVGSLCVGVDCNNGESFGFDTIRLKENNLRIRAEDTSSSASFPSVDWQLTFNDSSNGGANKFSVDDLDSGRTPFTIEASARTNALYVDDAGRIGVGTNTPVTSIHVKDGNTPTLRLEQDGSSGFTPQVWDVAGNETNFFVRDATNGSKLSFRIKPNAPESSVFIDTDGVGIYTNNPEHMFHVKSANGLTRAVVEETNATVENRTLMQLANNGGVRMNFADTSGGGETWTIQNASTRFRITNGTIAGNEFSLSQAGTLTLSGGLVTGTAGICTTGTPCDAVFDPEVYTVPTIEAHGAKMWADKHLPAVGPTLPNEPLDMTTKMLRMLNELEHAHIFIQQLNDEIGVLQTRLEELEDDKG